MCEFVRLQYDRGIVPHSELSRTSLPSQFKERIVGGLQCFPLITASRLFGDFPPRAGGCDTPMSDTRLLLVVEFII